MTKQAATILTESAPRKPDNDGKAVFWFFMVINYSAKDGYGKRTYWYTRVRASPPLTVHRGRRARIPAVTPA